METNFQCADCTQLFSNCQSDRFAVTQCGHFFHKSCLDHIFQSQSSGWGPSSTENARCCPICNKLVNKNEWIVLDEYPAIKSTLKFSVIVIGDMGIGKTCLTQNFTNEGFNLKTTPTIGTDMFKKTIVIGKETIRMTIWDTSGQQKFNVISRQHARNVQGVILAYDTTCLQSLKNTEKWLKFVREYAPVAETILVGCRSDLEDGCCRCKKPCRPPIQFEIRKMGEKLGGVHHFKTSAKADLNIENAFKSLTSKMLENQFLLAEARFGKAIGAEGTTLLDTTINTSVGESQKAKSPFLLSWMRCICG